MYEVTRRAEKSRKTMLTMIIPRVVSVPELAKASERCMFGGELLKLQGET